MLDENAELRLHKVLSTPDAPEAAILQGIAELGLRTHGLQLVHFVSLLQPVAWLAFLKLSEFHGVSSCHLTMI